MPVAHRTRSAGVTLEPSSLSPRVTRKAPRSTENELTLNTGLTHRASDDRCLICLDSANDTVLRCPTCTSGLYHAACLRMQPDDVFVCCLCKCNFVDLRNWEWHALCPDHRPAILPNVIVRPRLVLIGPSALTLMNWWPIVFNCISTITLGLLVFCLLWGLWLGIYPFGIAAVCVLFMRSVLGFDDNPYKFSGIPFLSRGPLVVVPN
jgi:hypothetical protein